MLRGGGGLVITGNFTVGLLCFQQCHGQIPIGNVIARRLIGYHVDSLVYESVYPTTVRLSCFWSVFQFNCLKTYMYLSFLT